MIKDPASDVVTVCRRLLCSSSCMSLIEFFHSKGLICGVLRIGCFCNIAGRDGHQRPECNISSINQEFKVQNVSNKGIFQNLESHSGLYLSLFT
jgi:hypothetical protein